MTRRGCRAAPRSRERLAARARAEIDHERLGILEAGEREIRQQLAPLVLRLHRAFLERIEREQVRARLDDQRGVAPLAWRGRDAELPRERIAIVDEQVRAHGHRGAVVERERERFGALTPVRHQPRDQPVRQRGREGDPRLALALRGDHVVDPRDGVPVEIGLDARRLRRLDQLLDHEQRDKRRCLSAAF